MVVRLRKTVQVECVCFCVCMSIQSNYFMIVTLPGVDINFTTIPQVSLRYFVAVLYGSEPHCAHISLQACTEMGLNCSTNNITDMFFPHVYNSTLYCEGKWAVQRRPPWFRTSMWGKGGSVKELNVNLNCTCAVVHSVA